MNFSRPIIVAAAVLTAALAVAAVRPAPPLAALGLQIRPLIYRETISPGEVKKGFVDIANPGASALDIEMSVQAFKQNAAGDLVFYDSPQVQQGIRLESASLRLAPLESWRVFFTIDSRKLPKGDVFAAVFASSRGPAPAASLAPRVRVGTLLVLQNGPPGPRSAAITSAKIPWLQMGDGVSGSLTVKNTGSTGGFFADGQLSLKPLGKTGSISGPLVMAGIERSFDFNVPTSQLGLYKLEVRVADASYSRWVFMITGFWRWALPAALALSGLASAVVWRLLALKKKRGAAT